MPNLNPLDTAQAGAASDILTAIKSKIGVIPNIYATMAHSPAVLKGFLAFNEALGEGALNAATREQIALAVAGKSGCDYCASAHTALAKAAGVDAAEANRNLFGEASDPKLAAIIKFARTVVESRGWILDGTLEDLRKAGVSDEELVEILAHIAVNLFTNYFNHVVETEIDFPVISTGDSNRAVNFN